MGRTYRGATTSTVGSGSGTGGAGTGGEVYSNTSAKWTDYAWNILKTQSLP